MLSGDCVMVVWQFIEGCLVVRWWLPAGSMAVLAPGFTMDAVVLSAEVVAMERTDTEYVETESIVGVSTLRRRLTRYDFVLGVIPLSLLSGTVLGAVTSISQELLLGVGALLCIPVLFDALYRNPPVSSEHESTTVDVPSSPTTDRMPVQDEDGRSHGPDLAD